MGWKIFELTTASPTKKITFSGRGSVFAEGDFGGGVIGAYPISVDVSGAETVCTNYIDDVIDGSTIKSIDCPSGYYKFELTGSAGATVNLWYNDQRDMPVKQSDQI